MNFFPDTVLNTFCRVKGLMLTVTLKCVIFFLFYRLKLWGLEKLSNLPRCCSSFVRTESLDILGIISPLLSYFLVVFSFWSLHMLRDWGCGHDQDIVPVLMEFIVLQRRLIDKDYKYWLCKILIGHYNWAGAVLKAKEVQMESNNAKPWVFTVW